MLMGHMGTMFFTLIFLCASFGSFNWWRNHTIAIFALTLLIIAFMFMRKPNSAQPQA